jgi:hypothetical protein
MVIIIIITITIIVIRRAVAWATGVRLQAWSCFSHVGCGVPTQQPLQWIPEPYAWR